MQKSAVTTVRVWDLPTRLFHWALVVLLVASYVTGQLGRMEWHILSGKLILSLVLFRILWGFVGGEHARFASFLGGPATAIGYGLSMMRGTARRYLGHNPMGAWSAVALLLFILLQAASGLFATDDIYTDGPLKYLVSDATSKKLTAFHSYWINVILALVALHLVAVLFYVFVKKDNLVAAMIGGDKRVDAGEAAAHARGGSVLLGVVLFALSAAIVFGALRLYGK